MVCDGKGGNGDGSGGDGDDGKGEGVSEFDVDGGDH